MSSGQRRERVSWTYYGVTVDPVGVNSSGIRWSALMGVGGYLKSDTKAGMRELIREHRNRRP